VTLSDVIDALTEAERLQQNSTDRLDSLLNILAADMGHRDEVLTWLYIQRFIAKEDASPEMIRSLFVSALCRLLEHKRVQDSWNLSQEKRRSRKGRR
jgi:hypothetical protein